MKPDKGGKILVVDDSKLNRTIIKNTLSELNMHITECKDGEEALSLITESKFDIILIDYIMPKMDGIGFIKNYKKIEKNNFIPIILMTGNEDLNSKIKGLNIGADDFLQKPINQRELVARVFSLLRMKRMHDIINHRNLEIKREMTAAKKVQEFIIPDDFSFIDYPKINGFYLPMEDIGGDFFDAYIIDDNVGILIADVTGHGIPAALIVTMSKMIFNIYSPKYTSTKELFEVVNKEVYKMLLDGQYFSAFYCLYNKTKKTLRFSNAGHVLPIYYRKRTDKILNLDTETGFFVGIMEESFFSEKAIKVEKGDRLFLYTDGIIEIKNEKKEEYGIERLSNFIKNNNSLQGKIFVDALYNDIMDFSYNKKRNDDFSFLNVEF